VSEENTKYKIQTKTKKGTRRKIENLELQTQFKKETINSTH
jgi:hypothetical protein